MNSLCALSTEFGIPVMQPLFPPTLTAEQLVEKIRSLPLAEYGEGVVVAFEGGELDGHRLKSKSDEYCLIHKAKERITEERHVVADIINGDIDDVLAQQTDEDRKRLEGYVRRFWRSVDEFVAIRRCMIEGIKEHHGDRKTFALAMTHPERDRYLERAVFHFFDQEVITHADVHQYVIDHIIKPNCGSRIKFTTMKQKVFKDVSFKY